MALTRLGRLLVVGVVLTLFIVMMSITIQPVPQYSIDEIMEDTDTHLGCLLYTSDAADEP